jgi:hypothetical protein
MPKYRFYNLVQNGQAVIARIDMVLDDDTTAISHAKQLIVGEAIEVWEGPRLVASFSASSNAHSPSQIPDRTVAGPSAQ